MATLTQNPTLDNLIADIDALDYAERVQWSIDRLEELASRYNALAMDLRTALAGQHEPTPLEALVEPCEADDDALDLDGLPWWASLPTSPELDTPVALAGPEPAGVYDQATAELHQRGLDHITRDQVVGALGSWSRRVYGDERFTDYDIPALATIAYQLIQRRASRV